MQPARRALASASLPAATAPNPGALLLGCGGCRRLRLQHQHQYLHRHQHRHQQRRAFSRPSPPRLHPTASTEAAVPPDRPPVAPPAAPAPRGLARLSSRRLISVSGPDAARYLQGVITANLFPGAPASKAASPDLQHLRRDVGIYAAFLTAQGRLLHDVFLYRDPRRAAEDEASGRTSWLVEVDADEAGSLQQHIRRYKLRARFDVRLVDEAEVRVWQAWDDAAPLSFISPSPPSGLLLAAVPDPRAPNLGHRILTFSSSASSSGSSSSSSSNNNNDNHHHPEETIAQSLLLLLSSGANHPPPPLVPEAAYTLRRYLHGVPEGPRELAPNHALPHESNMDLVPHAIDFRKGCYVGQELTVRTEHRGVVRKRVLPCLLYPASEAAQPSLGGEGEGRAEEDGVAAALARLYRPSVVRVDGDGGGGGGGGALTAGGLPAEASIGRANKSGRSAGKWLRGVGNVGLALCRLEIMTDVVLPGETGGTAGSYSPGDEFVVDLGDGAGGKVKIKAFVPDWLRRGLAEKEVR
ncbi:hypothetical protein VTJ83DRAFT_1198 [Remersonia thermophila]|uniref:Iron-sulfur cluster assembly factor IBA57 homolog, mitochondrial n=1 Tax=Remersonia thermophila TaxID=72144 RepID=A0ABR4DNL4_9PEZI